MKLHELAKLVRAKNAGPFMLTIDIMFENEENYRRVRDSNAISREMIASLYHLKPSDVEFFECNDALALKISFPRAVVSGSRGDTDVYGGQFHAPLVGLTIP